MKKIFALLLLLLLFAASAEARDPLNIPTASDDFNRSNSSDLGSPWITSEDNVMTFEVSSNQLLLRLNNCCIDQPNGPRQRGYSFYNGGFSADQFSEFVFQSVSGGGGALNNRAGGLAVRIADASYSSATLYCACYASGTFQVRKYVNQSLAGAGTILGSVSVTPIASDVIRLEVSGSSITLKRNGAAILGPITDTGIVSGQPGIASTGGEGQFAFHFFYDNWQGGDLVGARAAASSRSALNTGPSGSDSFNRADNNSLGSPWVESEGHSCNMMISISCQSAAHPNRLGLLVDAGQNFGGVGYHDQAYLDHQFSEIAFVTAQAAGGRAGPAVRVSGNRDSASGYWAAYAAGGTPTIHLRKLSSTDLEGVASFPGTDLGSIARTLAANDVLRVEVVNDQISVKVNGAVVIGPVTDPTVTTGKPGLVSWTSSGGSAQYHVWDTWNGGGIGVRASATSRGAAN